MKTNNVILWKARFADRAASGLKVEDWCKRNGVTKHAYCKIQGDQLVSLEDTFVEVLARDEVIIRILGYGIAKISRFKHHMPLWDAMISFRKGDWENAKVFLTQAQYKLEFTIII